VCSRSTCTVCCADGAACEAKAAPAAPSAASPMKTAAPTAAARREMCMMTYLLGFRCGRPRLVRGRAHCAVDAGWARKPLSPRGHLDGGDVQRTDDAVRPPPSYAAGGDLRQLSVARAHTSGYSRARTHEVTRHPPSDVLQTARPRKGAR